MFSGIVQATGRISSMERTSAGRRLLIDPRGWAHAPRAGDSICVSGCCLTLAAPVGPGGLLAFDVIPESLARTTLGGLGAGGIVNLESSVTAATPMDGHVVQGHVEGVGEVVGLQNDGEWRVRVVPPRELMPCIVPKGSIAVEGVSLTIAAVEPGAGWFEVALIPTTLGRTTLGSLAPGSRVNIETDILARTVVHVMRHYAGLLGA
ncbi:MAG TPA: riboflavin synthase [Phycisphaerales bacterium]|nr:riboflavin synthase [Phycisphaerales bacterium]